jgi:poly(3-hydroxybutyrate) depolymerase
MSAWEPDLEALGEGLVLLADVRAARGDEDGAAAHLTEALHVLKRRGAGRERETAELLERLVPMQERRLARGAAPGIDRELLEELVLLGELRAQSAAEGVEAAFRRALELARGVPDAGVVDVDLAGRAHLGLARASLDAELYGEAQDEVDAARALLAATPSPELWVAELYGLGMRVAAARGDEARVDRDAADARAWFDERMAAAVQPGRRLVALLRSHALLCFELGRGAEAEPLLRGADALEQRLGGPDAEPLGLALTGFAEDAFSTSMQQGITHLQSRRFADAVRSFETCRALRPDDPIAWYNLACAQASLGRPDPAFDALLRAVDLGYAYRDRAAELTAADPDLERLRADPRFGLVLERMHSLSAAAEAYAFAPLVHVPAGLARDARAPLLVVLHGNGRTKRSVVEGRWREVADALGYVLLAPSGRVPAGTDPEQGMLWIDGLDRYRARTWYFEKPVRDAVTELRRTRAIDPERVYLAGEDLGGTLAFNVAVHSPEIYRGCVLIDATVPFDLASEVAASLDPLGLRVALLADVEQRPPGMPRGRALHEHLAQTFRQLGEWGVDTTLATRAGGAGGETVARLVDAVRFLETGREGATARR